MLTNSELVSSTTWLTVENETLPETIIKIDVSLDPTKSEEREKRTNESIQNYEDTFGSLDMDKSYFGLFELLWYGQVPYFNVIIVRLYTYDMGIFVGGYK